MRPRSLLLFLAWAIPYAAHAETGAEAWLRYERVTDPAALQRYHELPSRIVQLGQNPIAKNAAVELARGLSGELGLQTQQATTYGTEDAFVLGTPAELTNLLPGESQRQLPPEGFRIARERMGKHTLWIIEGGTPPAELFAVFRLLEKIATLNPQLESTEAPSAPVRWVNQWDNPDGSIERGYAGRSIFFDAGHVRSDLTRAAEYARLLASVGINGCTVNNVNSDLRTLTPEILHEFARIADAFRPWGVRLSLSVDLSSPQVVGHLPTFDPLDPTVATWWQKKVEEIYTLIPDFGGFVVKADSEGRAGPSQYGRTPSQAANVLARALQPHHGVVLYRGFVYNHHLDWQDLKADRARAGYDNFASLDGTFEPNVIIQVKHGPIDFQIREPVSPLLAALQHTSQAIEVQTTQEYTGQQRHMVFLIPMWKTALDTDLRAQNRSTPVKEIVTGKSFHQPLGGFVSVVNVGLDANWLHHPMAMANLYGFGRLAWNPDLTSEQIADEWTRLTFGSDAMTRKTLSGMLLKSWRVYEEYTGPLGLQGLTDIVGNHYGVSVEASERNGWGQWHRADEKGVGMDRTVATGTGFIGQYSVAVARVYESVETCPDDLLLFMHHVPYTHVLHSGKTVIQSIYDSHYEGADAVEAYAREWVALKGAVDDQRYEEVLAQLQYQAGQAEVWRDAVTNWFLRASGISDEKGRVGRYPGRVEAESMKLEGYAIRDVTPAEDASGGKAVTCEAAQCRASFSYTGVSGWYAIRIQYFDQNNGAARYRVWVANQLVDDWTAAHRLPSQKIDSTTSTRRTISSVALRPGDEIRIEGVPNGGELAAVDY